MLVKRLFTKPVTRAAKAITPTFRPAQCAAGGKAVQTPSGVTKVPGCTESYIYGGFSAAGARTTSAMRERARQRGNLVIDNAFATHPGFSI